MRRHSLTDEQWRLVEHHFPVAKDTGRPPRDPRQMLDGILWILMTGAPWRDLPEEDFGPWQTVYDHFAKWRAEGKLLTVVEDLQRQLGARRKLDHQLWCVDGSIIRAARCAGGGGKKGIRRSRKTMRSAVLVGVTARKSIS